MVYEHSSEVFSTFIHTNIMCVFVCKKYYYFKIILIIYFLISYMPINMFTKVYTYVYTNKQMFVRKCRLCIKLS